MIQTYKAHFNTENVTEMLSLLFVKRRKKMITDIKKNTINLKIVF